ncbi:ATP-binding protein [Duncaniella freteri]|uniref:ATP-binding protein n=1 Tax=Duncaniella freteri TaxID=2530391 RepID=A0A4Z0V8Z3_9BACT|nr:ATP-binding protein [Duncaniella freteri]TGG39213.1 ATP-binding protein [Duncaniella freteri]TGG40904.1 ATP-binding protein [Duncaniella freteri]
MTTQEKQQISDQLRAYCEQKGSQNKAATALKVSSATVSKILAGNWETIADEMWRSIAGQINGRGAEGWQLVPTRAYNAMTFALENAQRDALVMAVIGEAGSGKTEAVKNYTAAGRNVYHLVCSEYWNRRTFMAKVLQTMGVAYSGNTVADMMDAIVDTLKRKETPLIVLDEADKLSDQVLYFFISLYNQLEDHCGIILTATSYLRARIEKGLRLNRKGYAEIFSRLGRKFVELPLHNSEDVAAVCVANGVTDTKTINSIIDEADGDLRRVKRSVWAKVKGGAK